jgi:hypothetical protein
VEYQHAFDWPSEIYKLDYQTMKMTSAFRAKNRAITDIVLLPDGTAVAAGYEPLGSVSRLPIPGKVVILRSSDLVTWSEMAVDYRAVANRVWLAKEPTGGLWAATDTGAILQLYGR